MWVVDRQPTGVYHPRNPRDSPLHTLVEDNFDRFEQIYDQVYEQEYGFWRPIIREVIDKYINCGDLHSGFARVRCPACADEYLLAFSCKGRYFCPSCHQKRVLKFAEWVTQELLEPVPHSQYVFTIPKMLRVHFKHDRKLLGALSRCAWETLQQYFQAALPELEVRPGVIVSIQTYGRTANYHPHLHLLCSDGAFDRQGAFHPWPCLDTQPMEALFRHQVLRMLLDGDKITPERVELLLSWKHSGFEVHRSRQLQPTDTQGQETLVAYLLHAPISQQRMVYDPASATVGYDTLPQPPASPFSVHEAGPQPQQTFTAMDWLAALTCHIPNKGEQTLHYYGFYSNKSRGQRRKAALSNSPQVSPVLAAQSPVTEDAELQEFRKAARRSWARLIKKVYEADPLICPRCQNRMEIIGFIEDPKVIKAILVHLRLWDVPPRPPPPGGPPPDTIRDYGFCDGLVS
jgi:hypothetical protein